VVVAAHHGHPREVKTRTLQLLEGLVHLEMAAVDRDQDAALSRVAAALALHAAR
jgi:hypothetical protein